MKVFLMCFCALQALLMLCRCMLTATPLPPLMVEGENGGRLYDFQQIAGISCCTEHPALRVHTRLLPWAEGVQESA